MLMKAPEQSPKKVAVSFVSRIEPRKPEGKRPIGATRQKARLLYGACGVVVEVGLAFLASQKVEPLLGVVAVDVGKCPLRSPVPSRVLLPCP